LKKAELKQALRPLIRECVKEVIFEEGILSGIISEVVQGLGATTIVEQKVTPPVQQQERVDTTKQLRETKQKMLDAIGREAYGGVDLFEGTTPTTSAPHANSASPSSAGSPMANMDPQDPGVDISGILDLAGGSWKQI